jgi:hypothetical protein
VPALLDLAGSADAMPERPPAGLEEAVLDRFARERPRTDPERSTQPDPARDPGPRQRTRRARARAWLSRPLPVAATAAALGALVPLAVSGAFSGSGAPGAHAYGASLRGTGAAPTARAYAHLSTEAAGTRVELWVRGMQPTPGAVYELWCIGRGGTKVSAGTFRVDASGRARVRLTTAARLGEYERLTVQRHGVAGPVMTGAIEY